MDSQSLPDVTKRGANPVRTPPPSAQDQLALWVDRANRRSMNALLSSMEPAVFVQARRFAFISGLDIDDLKQEARIAVVRAFDTYNPSLGCNLFSYVRPRIEWWLMRVTKSQSGIVRLPINRWDKGKRPRKALSMSLPKYTTDNGVLTIGEYLDGVASMDAFTQDRTADHASLGALELALTQLDPARASVLLRRADGDTLETIGADIGVSRERVRQIEGLALERLRVLMRTGEL